MSMRICMITYSFYESDNRVKRYSEAFAKRGDHVDVIALQIGDRAHDEKLGKKKVIKGVNVYKLQRRLRDEKNKYSYLFRIVQFLFKASAFATWKHIRQPYQLVHVHSIPDFAVFSALFPKLFGAKVILDIHDIVPELYVSKFDARENSLLFKVLLWVEKMSTAFADHVIIANDIWKNKMASRSVNESKCSVYMNYPDEDIFYPRERKRKDDQFIIMYPGSLSMHQGLTLAVKAFGLVHEQLPKTEFHIYGSGADEGNIHQAIESLGLQDKVKMFKSLSIEQIAEKIADADLCLEPKTNSFFSDEAFSTKILEFMAMGIPVLTSDNTVHTYYLTSDVVVFFKSGDVEDMARHLLAVVKDEPLRKRLVRNGLVFIEQLKWKNHKQRYFDLVDNLLRK